MDGKVKNSYVQKVVRLSVGLKQQAATKVSPKHVGCTHVALGELASRAIAQLLILSSDSTSWTKSFEMIAFLLWSTRNQANGACSISSAMKKR